VQRHPGGKFAVNGMLVRVLLTDWDQEQALAPHFCHLTGVLCVQWRQ